MEIQWALVLFTAISGTGAWLFAWAMIGWLTGKASAPSKADSIVSFVLLAVGGCCSVAHLKHVDRIFEALNHPTSGIFIEAAMIGVTCVLVAIFFILLLRKSSDTALKVVGILAALVGIVFTYECGSSYMMEARPVWCTPAVPVAYAGTAAGAGGALYLLMVAVQKRGEDEASFAGLLSMIGSAIALVCAIVFAVAMGDGIASGEMGAFAWVVAMIAGDVVSFVCCAIAWKKPQMALAMGALALAGAVVAAVCMRCAMWLVGEPVLNFFLMPLD